MMCVRSRAADSFQMRTENWLNWDTEEKNKVHDTTTRPPVVAQRFVALSEPRSLSGGELCIRYVGELCT